MSRLSGPSWGAPSCEQGAMGLQCEYLGTMFVHQAFLQLTRSYDTHFLPIFHTSDCCDTTSHYHLGSFLYYLLLFSQTCFNRKWIGFCRRQKDRILVGYCTLWTITAKIGPSPWKCFTALYSYMRSHQIADYLLYSKKCFQTSHIVA